MNIRKDHFNSRFKYLLGLLISLFLVSGRTLSYADEVIAQSESWNHRVWIWQESEDSLSNLAQRYYGDAREWPRIYEANRDQIKNPHLIYPKQWLRIPSLDDIPKSVQRIEPDIVSPEELQEDTQEPVENQESISESSTIPGEDYETQDFQPEEVLSEEIVNEEENVSSYDPEEEILIEAIEPF